MRARLEQVFRTTDYLIRWGGEEFLVVARQTRREHATELAERLRQTVAGQPFATDPDPVLRKTCSIGFACLPFAPEEPGRYSWQQLLEVADRCLYAVKHAGRDGWAGVLQVAPAGMPLDARQLIEKLTQAESLSAFDGLVDWASSVTGRSRSQGGRTNPAATALPSQ